MRSLFLLLAGCPAVTGSQYDDRVRDFDGDGSIAERFGGPDCRDADPTITDCDQDDDGVRSFAAGGLDCDDTDPDVSPEAVERCNTVDDDCDGLIDNQDPDVDGPIAFYSDGDADGSGDPGKGYVCQEYTDPADPETALHANNALDCDDADPAIGPHATEVCDGRDNDCDGATDDSGVWLEDADGDGFGADGTQVGGPCFLQPDAGAAGVGGDCDDTDDQIHPGATEPPYDGVDSNCNGGRDDWDADFDGFVPADQWAAAQAANALLPPDQQWDLEPGDCDDADPRAHDGAVEVCDGVDNDCDGSIDTADLDGAGPTDELVLRGQLGTWYVDADGDGSFGTQVALCPAEVQAGVHSPTGDDCYDGGTPPVGFAGADPAQVHPGHDETCDGYDDDCDGLVDYAFTSFPGSIELWVDNDGDGFGAAQRYGCAVDPGRKLVDQGEDCNDAAANVFPGAPEICGDAVRQDCSQAHIFDCDGDGAQGAYVGGGDGTDCEDQRADVNPSVTVELCDGLDNDCDGLLDSADVDDLDAGPEPLWYPDLDGDGYGFDDGSGVQQCDQPAGRAPNADDCDDLDPTLTPLTVWYADLDGDGYGNPASTTTSCLPPIAPNAVRIAGDCDDTDAAYLPGAQWSFDADGDGFGAPGSAQVFCKPPTGEPWVSGLGDDCADDDDTRFPGAPELADGIDNDCDGVIDGGSTGVAWYVDADGDGYGEAGSVALPWAPGRVLNDDDCDDTRTAVNPSAQVELCDGLDNNCDGFTVDGSPDVSNPWQDTIVPGDEGFTYLATDPSGTLYNRLVTVCGVPDVPTLSTPSGPLSLEPFTAADLALNANAFTTCDDGTTGTLYLRDADGDGVPAMQSAQDARVLCNGGPAPAGFQQYTGNIDCAPYDSVRRVLLAPGEYGDLDGDFDVSPWLTPGACAAFASASAGTDCNDHSTDTTGPHAQGATIEVTPDQLPFALQACNDAELLIEGYNSFDGSVFGGMPVGTELTLRGPADELATVEITGPLQATVIGTLRFRDLALLGDAADGIELRVEGQLELERVESLNVGFTTLIGQTRITDSTLDAHPSNTTIQVIGPNASAVLQDSVFRGGDLAFVDQGFLSIEDSDLSAMDSGIDVVAGTLEAQRLVFTDVAHPVQVSSGGFADLSGIRAEAPLEDGTFQVDGGTLRCTDCVFDGPGRDGPAFLANGGVLELERAEIEVGDVGLRVTAGVLDARGLNASASGNVLDNRAEAWVRDAVLRGTGLNAILRARGGATHTLLEQVDLVTSNSSTTGLQVESGSLTARDLAIAGPTYAIEVSSALQHDIDGLTIELDDRFDAFGLFADAGDLTVQNAWITGTQGKAIEAHGDLRLSLLGSQLTMASGMGLDLRGSTQAVVEGSIVEAGDLCIEIEPDQPTDYPTLEVRRSRLFGTQNKGVLRATHTLVQIEQSLLHNPGHPNATDSLLKLIDSPATLDRVTLFGQGAGQSTLHIATATDDAFVARHLLIWTLSQDGGAFVITCDIGDPVSLEDTLITGDVDCPGYSGLVFDENEFGQSFDDVTYLPTDTLVLTYFGETALPLPYPGGQ